jgi:hypothetical protein
MQTLIQILFIMFALSWAMGGVWELITVNATRCGGSYARGVISIGIAAGWAMMVIRPELRGPLVILLLPGAAWIMIKDVSR